MRVVVVTPPDPLKALPLAAAKKHLEVDHVGDDALIIAAIAAAFGHIDGPSGWLGRAVGRQTLEARGAIDTGAFVRLPFPPIISLVDITYLDAGDAPQTVDVTDVEVFADVFSLAPPAMPWSGGSLRNDALRIRYLAGYAEGQVPAPIVAALKLMVGDLYAFRESATDSRQGSTIPMSATVESLLAPFRIYG